MTLGKFKSYLAVLMLISLVELIKIPARLLEEAADTSAVPLSMLFNLSFKQGRLPKLWKSANITLIYKDDDREPVENYRGISLLTISGKCLYNFLLALDHHPYEWV